MVSKNIAYGVLKKDEFRCRLCDVEHGIGKSFHIHHIVPKSLRGEDNITNLVLLCESCHKEVPHDTNLNRGLSKRIYDTFLLDLKKDHNKLNEGQRDDLWIFVQREVIKKRFYNYIKALTSNKPLSGKNIVKIAKRIIREHPEYFEALIEYEKTGRLPKVKWGIRTNFIVDKSLLRKFRNYCKKEGYKMSTKIEQYIIKELSNT